MPKYREEVSAVLTELEAFCVLHVLDNNPNFLLSMTGGEIECMLLDLKEFFKSREFSVTHEKWETLKEDQRLEKVRDDGQRVICRIKFR